MSPKKFKVYEKLNPKERMGLLSRHIMSVASNCGISPKLIELFNKEKENYAWRKKIYKEKLQLINNMQQDDPDRFKTLIDSIKHETLYHDSRHRLSQFTHELIGAVSTTKAYKDRVQQVKEQENN